jgi:hypothetical protein
MCCWNCTYFVHSAVEKLKPFCRRFEKDEANMSTWRNRKHPQVVAHAAMTKAHSVVLVEDDDNDVLLMRLGFGGAEVENELVVARNGEEAIELLTKCEDALRLVRAC